MSEPNQMLRIEQLRLKNFRCFSECEVNFHPTLTVLIAENGQGKTAILDAIRKALLIFTQHVGKSAISSSIDQADVHLDKESKAQLPTRFDVKMVMMNRDEQFGREVRKYYHRPRNTKEELRPFLSRCAELRNVAFGISDETLPLAAFYGTGRLFDQLRLTSGKKFVAAESPYRAGAYLDSLSPSASYKVFAAWYEAQMNKLANPASKITTGGIRPELLLAAVEEAVKVVLAPTGWTQIGWEHRRLIRTYHQNGRLRLHNPQVGWLPLEFLSDGIQNMVALVADLAHKCARLNPHFGVNAASKTPGIVLIDEVDMHLHPQWQQTVIGLLQEAFPYIQFIVTTHSPHVLSTVNSESIRIISQSNGEAVIEIPSVQTKGDESGNVLARTMNVDPVPDVPQARQLSEYLGLVQNGQDNSGKAIELWNGLIQHFGESHHLLQEAAVLRRFQDFKRTHKG